MDAVLVSLKVIGFLFVFLCCSVYARNKSATLSNWWEAYVIGLFYCFMVLLVGYGVFVLVKYLFFI